MLSTAEQQIKRHEPNTPNEGGQVYTLKPVGMPKRKSWLTAKRRRRDGGKTHS